MKQEEEARRNKRKKNGLIITWAGEKTKK